jgi:hypothetical protein
MSDAVSLSRIKLFFLDWNSQTADDCKMLGLHPWCMHTAAQVIAEREVWDFADANPDIDVTSSTFTPYYSNFKLFLSASLRSSSRLPIRAIWPRTGR